MLSKIGWNRDEDGETQDIFKPQASYLIFLSQMSHCNLHRVILHLTLSQSEASIQVTWSILTNQRCHIIIYTMWSSSKWSFRRTVPGKVLFVSISERIFFMIHITSEWFTLWNMSDFPTFKVSRKIRMHQWELLYFEHWHCGSQWIAAERESWRGKIKQNMIIRKSQPGTRPKICGHVVPKIKITLHKNNYIQLNGITVSWFQKIFSLLANNKFSHSNNFQE